jgi:hypothetical protein
MLQVPLINECSLPLAAHLLTWQVPLVPSTWERYSGGASGHSDMLVALYTRRHACTLLACGKVTLVPLLEDLADSTPRFDWICLMKHTSRLCVFPVWAGAVATESASLNFPTKLLS